MSTPPMRNQSQDREYPRLLIISHNALSDTKSNGKILTSLLCKWPENNIAQLYFWNELPSQTICSRFFRLRDHDILRANLTGTPAKGTEIDPSLLNTELSPNAAERRSVFSSIAYWLFNRRMALAELIRDIMWRASKSITPQLIQWLDEFSPEVVLFQGSHMPFAYKMSLWVCERYNAQLQIILSDDYTFVRNKLSPFAWLNNARYIKWFTKGLMKSSASYAVVPAMKAEYEKKYKCGNIYVASNCLEIRPFDDGEDISSVGLKMLYAGNVGLNRWRTLRKLGLCLAELAKEGHVATLDIYTPSPIPESIQQALTCGNSMSYKGSLSTEELLETIQQSNVLVHVESFDRKNMLVTRMSLSTKIPESMMAGRCLLAIGPSGISSIEYLKQHQAAVVICKQNIEEIKKQVMPIFNIEHRRKTAKTAYELAIKNHDVEKIRELIWQNATNQTGDLK